MPSQLLQDYQSFTDAAARADAARADAIARQQALVASMPEGVLFSTTPDHPVLVKRVGQQIVTVAVPFLGDEVQS